jgi:K+-sensing histidine kinase KdpD
MTRIGRKMLLVESDQILEQERQIWQQQLQQRHFDLSSLTDISQALASKFNLQEVIELALPAVVSIIGSEAVTFWLADRVQTTLTHHVTYQAGHFNYQDTPCLLFGEGSIGQAVAVRTSRLVHNAAKEPDVTADGHARLILKRDMMILPLHQGEKVMGVLELINKLEGEFTAYDQALAETLASSFAIAIANVRLFDSLQDRMAELEEQNQELDAFAHTVAHDLVNPLNHIIGFADVLTGRLDLLPLEETKSYLTYISRAAHKMMDIIQSLMLLAGIRQKQVIFEAIDMELVVAEAEKRLQPMIEEFQAQIVKPDKFPVSYGYAPWIEEVWVNYLNNAIKYGGRPPQLILGATVQKDKTVRFWVQDNGAGLSEEESTKLFIPFTRLGHVKVPGYGLGLSIVQRIIERLNGEVGVESEPGKGSVFYFTLPGEE